MNQDLFYILMVYVFFPIIFILILIMGILMRKEIKETKKNRESGICDIGMAIGYLNAVLKFVNSSKELSKEDKQKIYKEIVEFLKQYPH